MAWTWYASLTIDHTQVTASGETYLRVPFYGSADLATVPNGGTLTNVNGYDVIFSTDTAGASPLVFELEQNTYDPTTGAGMWWVHIPFPSTSVNTVIYVVFANSSITTYQGNTNGTWGSDYDAVIHFNASGTQDDSTATGNNLTSTGGSPSYTAGLLGLAFDSGGSDYLYLTTMSGLVSDGPCTLSCWYKLASPVVSGNVCIVGMGGNGATNCRALALPGATEFVVDTGTVDPECSLTSSTNWVNMVIVIPASGTPNSMLVYLNGALQSTSGGNNTAFALTSAGSYLTVGCIPGAPGAGDFMAGLIDELRYAPRAIDAGLIATEYQAQKPGTTFYTLGTKQPQSGGISGVAQGLVQCSGAASFFPTVVGARGTTQTFGTVKGVKIKTTAHGMVHCSGAIDANIIASVTAEGRVQTSGHVGLSRIGASASGMVQTSGFATVPYVGSTVPCLTATTPPNPTPGGTSGNRVY